MAENRGFDGVFSQLSEDAEGEPAPIATTKSFWKRRVFDVTPVTILIYVLVTIVIAVSVGLIVHFAHPCDSCSCPSFPAAPSPTAEIDDDDFWKRCVEMSLERDECLPGCNPCVSEEPQTTSSPPPGESVPATGYRLPTALRPFHYSLELRPQFYDTDPALFRFDGHVDIHITVEEETNALVLNTKQLNLTSITLESSVNDVNVLHNSSDPQRELYNATLDRTLERDEYIKASIDFEGDLLNDKIGLYWSSYKEAGDTKYMAVTQFAATDARKAFPCFDEPAFKATFNVSVWRKPGMMTVANTPNYTSEERDEWIVDRFERTPNMSTYILAIAVSQYDYVETNASSGLQHKEMKYYARPEAVTDGFLEYTVSKGPHSFNYYETYFDYPYAISKLDMLAVPDFAFSAMENWGLCTYRESVMLLDNEYSSLVEKRRMTIINAHEIVHQWLGNLVTCAWFDDVWLNEGMASYFEIFAVPVVEPSWDMWQIFTIDVHSALIADSTGRSKPIYHHVETPTEALDSYSTITYEKAACFLRMVHHLVLGDDTFHNATKDYLKTHAFSNANHSHIIKIWQEHADRDGLDVDVETMALTWLRQSGYPVVTFTRQGTQVHVTQNMFLQTPELSTDLQDSEYDYKWEVPVRYITSSNTDAPEIIWLHQTNESVTVPSEDWVLGNTHQDGFYRVNYDEDNWALLIALLQTDHLAIDPINRGQLIDDALHLARAGLLDLHIALTATEYLPHETKWQPWAALKASLPYVDYMLFENWEYGSFREYVRQLTNSSYVDLGWDWDGTEADSTPITTSHLRVDILEMACLYDLSDCVAQAQDMFAQWLLTPDDMTMIRPDLRFVVYCTGITHAVSSQPWDQLFVQYQLEWHGPSGIDRPRIARALACSRQRWILERYFGMVAEGDPLIHPDDGATIMTAVATNPIGHYVAWDFLNKLGKELPNKNTVLDTVVLRFNTEFDMEKLEGYIQKYPAVTDTEQKHYSDLRQKTRANIRFRDDNVVDVIDWLEGVVGDARMV